MSILKENIKLLIESLSIKDLDRDDVRDILNVFFRNWLEEKKPEINQKKFAITYLYRRYFNEFLRDFDLDKSEDDDEYDFDTKNIITQLLDRGLIELPIFHEHGDSFLEVYKKNFDFLVKRLDLPDFMRLEFSEDEPYKLSCKVFVDFVGMIKSDVAVPSSWGLHENLEKLLKNYMGLPVGAAKFGSVEISVENFIFEGYDIWLKTVFPLMKKKIKMKLGESVKSIRGSIENDRRFKIHVYFTRNGWLTQPYRKNIMDIWNSFGYSDTKRSIE